MTQQHGHPVAKWFLTLLLAGSGLGLPPTWAAAPTILFSTGFEPIEGYDPAYELAGQLGWVGTGDQTPWDNGLTSGYLPELGQQAYVGYSIDATNDVSYSVWKPIDLRTIPANFSVIEFSVMMTITDSPSELWDDFRWSVYNADADRLFSIDFDNLDLSINYLLQDSTNFVYTGSSFTNDVPYHLQVFMDFARNRWNARLNGQPLVNGAPITTANSALNLGDVDAVWVIRFFDEGVGYPGENIMAFDNYRVVGHPAAPPQPSVIVRYGKTPSSPFYGRVAGEPQTTYAVEVSTDLHSWIPVSTNAANASGLFDFIDFSSVGVDKRFYRTRLVP